MQAGFSMVRKTATEQTLPQSILINLLILRTLNHHFQMEKLSLYRDLEHVLRTEVEVQGSAGMLLPSVHLDTGKLVSEYFSIMVVCYDLGYDVKFRKEISINN